jgi:hypothetical protein
MDPRWVRLYTRRLIHDARFHGSIVHTPRTL